MILATLFVFVIAFLLLVLFGAGVWMLYLGLRGRIEGDDPRCARCGFNLSGHAEIPLRCAECGAELYDELAVHYGRRVRSRAQMLCGGSLIVVSVVPILVAGCF